MLKMNKLARVVLADKLMKYVFFVSAIFSIFVVFSICLFIFTNSIPAFREIGVIKFMLGLSWNPSAGDFGIFPMIIGSVYVTALAILFGGVTGVFTAIYLARFCPKKLKIVFTNLVNLLAGIPSIVYGFFGVMVLVPFIKTISPNGIGEGLLSSSLILAVMILPTVTSICKTNIEAVDKTFYDAAIALGSTHEQTVFGVVVPGARSGIFTAIVLGTGRAIGETMAVIMIAGNAPYIPTNLFSYFRTLTINIALEMGYATGLHRSALIATGFVLLIFILILNIALNIIKDSGNGKGKAKPRKLNLAREKRKIIYKNNTRLTTDILKYISMTMTFLSICSLLFITIFILIKGLPNITFDLLFGKSGNGQMTLFPAIVSTSMLLFLSLAIAIPVGTFAGIYMVEYAKSGGAIVRVVRVFTESLSGIPSIIFGLFGMILFSNILGFGRSLLAGSFTLTLIILPAIVRQTEETLMSIPLALREGSLALGASKVRTIFKVVLPCAVSGITTSVLLSIGRIVGESAALIYTAGAVRYMPKGYMSAGSSFAVMMWMFASEGLYVNQAFATASVLLILVFVINGCLFIIDEKSKRTY